MEYDVGHGLSLVDLARRFSDARQDDDAASGGRQPRLALALRCWNVIEEVGAYIESSC